MKASDAIRQLISKSQWSQNRMGMALGVTPQTFSTAMRRHDMKAGTVARALDLLGYELWAIPKGTKAPQGSIQITAPDESAHGVE